MKKLLLTAFICVFYMVSSARAVERPSCSDVQKEINKALGGIQNEEDRQRRMDAVLAHLQKDPEADIYLGLMAYCGVGVPKDFAKGVRLLENGLRAGKTNAFLMLLAIYAGVFGDGDGWQDETKLRHFLSEVGRSGTPEMQFLLGQAYYRGEVQLGVVPSRSKTEQLWIRAASQGWVEAYAALGSFYTEAQNYEAARKWLELGKAAGDVKSRQQLEVLLAKVPQ